MNDKDARSRESDITDAEFDNWLQDVKDSICDSLDDVVDTETDLLRLKQHVAKKAVAVAHASGCDGPDRAIRSVFVDDPDSPTTPEARAERAVLNRAPGRFANGLRVSFRYNRVAMRRVLTVRLVAAVAVAAVAVVTLIVIGRGESPTVILPVYLALLVIAMGHSLWRSIEEVRAARKIAKMAILGSSRAVRRVGDEPRLTERDGVGGAKAERGNGVCELGARTRFFQYVVGTFAPPPPRYLSAAAQMRVRWLAETAVQDPCLRGLTERYIEIVVDGTQEPELEYSVCSGSVGDVGAEVDSEREEPPVVTGGSGSVAVRSSHRRKRLASATMMRRAPQRPPGSPRATKRIVD